MTIREILTRREAIRTELRTLIDAHPDGALPDEVRTRADALETEPGRLNELERRQALLDELDRRAEGRPIGGTNDARLDTETRQFSITRAIAGAAGLAVDNGREREISAELARRSGRTFEGIAVPLTALAPERRALTASGTSNATIGTDLLASEFIDRLWPALVVRRLGARILSGLTGNVAIPKKTASATGYWVADGAAVTESDQTFDQLTLSPKHAGALTELSRSMLLQSSPDIDALIRSDLANVLAQALDLAALNGSGSSNQPRGILNTVGIGSVAMGANGGALTYDAPIDLMGQIEDANAETAAMAFVTNYKVRRAALKITAGADALPLGEDKVFQSVPRAFTNNVPSNGTKGSGTNLSTLLYGDFSQLLIGVWSELDILVNPYESVAYSKGSVQVRAMMSVDIAVRHAESFAAITDLTA